MEKSEGGWASAPTALEAIKGSDAVVILTEWEEFRSLNWSKVATLMRSPSWIFDTRSIIDLEDAKKYGLNIWSIGLGN